MSATTHVSTLTSSHVGSSGRRSWLFAAQATREVAVMSAATVRVIRRDIQNATYSATAM